METLLLLGLLMVAGCHRGSETGGDADADADTDADPDTGAGADADTDTDPDTGADADADARDGDIGEDADSEGDGEAGPGDADIGHDADWDEDGSLLECTFNRDCPEDRRCECDELEGCYCRVGERGTGRNGIDTCEDGNDCASSLCVEGPGGVFYCSDECEDDEDCGPNLPICRDIAYLGRICIRASS